jgi:hypothetical protein
LVLVHRFGTLDFRPPFATPATLTLRRRGFAACGPALGEGSSSMPKALPGACLDVGMIAYHIYSQSVKTEECSAPTQIPQRSEISASKSSNYGGQEVD